jgi:hypothetical protein
LTKDLNVQESQSKGTSALDIHPCQIFIDKEGQWFYRGAQMRKREIVRLFYDHMSMDDCGRYILDWAGERCFLEVEDTAYTIRKVAAQEEFILTLSDDSNEKLAPETLYVGKENVLYCRVRGRFPARFTRPAYYQLAAHVEETDGEYFLPVAGRRYRIQDSLAGKSNLER